MRNRAADSVRRRTEAGSGWLRWNGRALRVAAFAVLLPVPVALAAPHTTGSSEQVLAMSSVPVGAVGDAVLPRVLPLSHSKSGAAPSASLTRLARAGRTAAAAPSAVAASGIPAAALRAYRRAEVTMSIADPGCGLSWALLAGIGRVESDHGRFGGAVLGRDGVSTPEIIGLPLNGVGPVSAIKDTDGGRLDGDRRWDRAVGPMQFIPTTWAMVGVDGDGDGVRDPHDLDDAALAAATYLCAGAGDLTTTAGQERSVYSYNHSLEYVRLVLALANAYDQGVVDLPALDRLAAPPQLPTTAGRPVTLRTGSGVRLRTPTDQTPPKPRTRAKDRTKGSADGTGARGRNGERGGTGTAGDRGGPKSKNHDGRRTGGGSGDPAPTKPGGRGTEPGDSTPAPGGSTPTPGNNTPTPGGDTPSPGGNTPAPGNNTPTPGNNSPTPGGNTPTPGGGTGNSGGPTPSPSPGPGPQPDPLTGVLGHCADDAALLCLTDAADEVTLLEGLDPADFQDWIAAGTVVTVVYRLDQEQQAWVPDQPVEEATQP